LVCVAVAAAVLFAVGILFHFGIPVVAPSIPTQFANAALFRPWLGWTSIYMALHPLWFGVVFAAVYLGLRSRGALPLGWRGGLVYGLGVFLVGSLPVYVLAYAAFSVSPEVIGSWVAQSLCQYLAAGAAIGAIAGLV
jgi:hypothetical protein